MRANCNRLVSVVYPPNTRKVAGSSPARNIVNTLVVVVVTFCPSFIKAYYVATRVSFFLTLCFNVGYLSAD